jgi:hypothetical protein
MRRPAGHDGVLASKRAAGGQCRRDGRQNDRRLRQPSGAELATGHGSFIRRHDQHAAFGQTGEVGLGGSVLPHAHIHCRRRQHALVGCQQQGSRQVIGQARRHFRQNIGAGRHHRHQIGGARQLDMAHFAFIGEREQLRIDLLAGQRLQRERGDELRAGFCQHGCDTAAGFGQQPDQFQRLIRRDAAGDDEEEFFSGETQSRQP